jgi:hypothetical protein
MPFKSQAQRKYLHAKEPKLAKEWEAKYPVKKPLPKKVKAKK